jgi:hypothetical protein
MIDRALIAGIAIGIGATLIASQLFISSPVIGVFGIGVLLVAGAGVYFWDLREQREQELEETAEAWRADR